MHGRLMGGAQCCLKGSENEAGSRRFDSRVATVREIIHGQEKVKENQVSKKSGNSVFRFIVHKFSSRLKKCIFFGKR